MYEIIVVVVVVVQLGKVRMKVPCRSVTCDHLQCFDAITYLRMNEKKPTWFCPVCDRHAEYNKLIIDGSVTQLLLLSLSEHLFNNNNNNKIK